MTDDEVNQQKEIAAYRAMAAAWLDTRIEFDRSLLTLSAGGIALLAAFLSRDEAPPASCIQVILYTLGIIGFGITVVTTLWTFARNTKPLVEAMHGGAGADALLKGLGVAAAIGFGFGALATMILAFTFTTTTRGDQCMEKKTTTSVRPPLERRLGFQGVGTALIPVAQKPAATEAPASEAPAPAQQQQQPAASAAPSAAEGGS